MRATQNIGLILVVVLLPFMLGNKSCERSTTWGPKYVSKWEEDHALIDSTTKCSDCHEDIESTESKPKSHDAAWIRNHGGYGNLKYGLKNENVCYRCHAEAKCTECHQQEEPATHTEFWKRRGHGAFVGLDRQKCVSCHQDVQFCERCHSTTEPTSHNAAWGGLTNNHCNSCHFPLTSVGGQQCAACHTGTPSHNSTPTMPGDARHVAGADCRTCHVNLRHLDNGDACTVCHTQ